MKLVALTKVYCNLQVKQNKLFLEKGVGGFLKILKVSHSSLFLTFIPSMYFFILDKKQNRRELEKISHCEEFSNLSYIFLSFRSLIRDDRINKNGSSFSVKSGGGIVASSHRILTLLKIIGIERSVSN